MAAMVVEYDTESGAFYVRITDEPAARTFEASTFVSVDLDAADNVVGLELLCLPSAVTADERAMLEAQYPAAVKALSAAERLTRLSA